MTGHLVVIFGLPGVGKTNVAEIAAARMGSVHLSIDAVEESILACGLPSGWQVGVAAYEAARAMAELNAPRSQRRHRCCQRQRGGTADLADCGRAHRCSPGLRVKPQKVV
ncbi:hypothetical protein ACFWB0_25465 [Rhodococcus sp. NPDC060086]|uniref:hypothetical protein n=1 Tax=Rhodococcus sp. NPDC060086 TaxID=3347055 RepID=UPI003651F29F